MLLFVTALISGLSMCALASWFVARNYTASAPAWVPIVTLCICIFCDASGLQPVSMVVIGEIFSFKVSIINNKIAAIAAVNKTKESILKGRLCFERRKALEIVIYEFEVTLFLICFVSLYVQSIRKACAPEV
jgi:hypothetical protein